MDNELSKIIGDRINTLLAKNDFKQKDLAEWTGIKPENTISYFCSGKRIPNTSQLKKIADFFGTTTDYLLGRSTSSAIEAEFIKLNELTGLSDEAIEKMWEEYAGGWRGEDSQANKIMCKFVEYGLLGQMAFTMSNYCNQLRQHIDYLKKLYEEKLSIFESRGSGVKADEDAVYVEDASDYIELDFITIDDTTENKQKMKISLFDMAEIPKDFIKEYSSELQDEYKEIISKIQNLSAQISKMKREELYRALEQFTKEGDQDGKDSQEE